MTFAFFFFFLHFHFLFFRFLPALPRHCEGVLIDLCDSAFFFSPTRDSGVNTFDSWGRTGMVEGVFTFILSGFFFFDLDSFVELII